MSWAPQVQTDDTGKWYGNGLRFATKQEAEGFALDLSWRWTAVRETRATEVDEPVKHRWADGRVSDVEIGAAPVEGHDDTEATKAGSQQPDGAGVRTADSPRDIKIAETEG